MTELLMFSGGLDSTYILNDLMKKNEKVWVHHITLINTVEERWVEEREAAREIVKWLWNKYRKFPYTESEWSFPFSKFYCWDMDIVTFVAAQIIPNIYAGQKIKLTTGRVMDDDESQSSIKQVERTQKMWETAKERFDYMAYNEINRPIKNKYKKELIPELPKDLLDLVWYCRRPVEGRPCGACKSCKDMEKAINIL
jgi:7-cyano-7-deazaguanine synthase in queuosine biosynthesis